MTSADAEEPLMMGGTDSDSDELQRDPVRRSRNRYAAEGYHIVHNNNNKGFKSDYFGDTPSRGRTAVEKQLCILLILCVIVIIILSIVVVVVNINPTDKAVCETEYCVEHAGLMLSKMNTSADPCINFYEYACSGFVHNPLIPPTAVKYGMFQEVSDRNSAILNKLLSKPGSLYKGVNSTAVAKAKIMYNTCMNVSAVEDVPNEKLLQVIKDMGSWPLLNDSVAGEWNSATWMIEEALSRSFWYQASPLFTISVTADSKNSSVQRIVFDQGGLTLSEHRYLGNDTQRFHDLFIPLFKTIATLLGATGDLASDAREVWDLEMELAKAFDPPESRVDPEDTYHKMTLADLQEIFEDQIDLSEYLKRSFKEEIPQSEEVLVQAPSYLRKMSALIGVETKRTLANYIVWHTVMSFIPVMPMPYRLALSDLTQALQGTSGSGELWATCVDSTRELLGFATGALYVEEHFPAEDKENVEAILSNIRSTFEASLPEVDWMDEETKSRALEKSRAIMEKIGYPAYIQDPQQLDQYYENLTLLPDAPFDNDVNTRFYQVEKYYLQDRKKPTDKHEWHMSPDEVNAYYSSTSNEIVFPAGILQNPFYDNTLPMYYIYGVMGMVMGHELTHAFDNVGRLFDIEGNLNNWWTNHSAKEFLEKSQCLVDEYDKFKVQGQHVNGLTTLGENIADNGGLKTAYKAYYNWADDANRKELPLPGLNLTIDQTFFLGFAQLWCAYYTPEYAISTLATDVHTNAKYRILGTLYNMPEFAEAYNCPKGSMMNPETRCSVW